MYKVARLQLKFAFTRVMIVIPTSSGGGGGGGGAAVGRRVVPAPAAIGCRAAVSASGPSVPEELSSDSGPRKTR